MLAKKALSATAGAPKLYVEDVFNTYLTTGAGSAITVTNDIDLSGEGGLVWTKTRNTTGYHVLFDTERGANSGIYTNTTDAQATYSNWLSFNNNGFTIGTINNLATSSTTGVSFTFRKAEKFFDVVTYTGNDTSGRTVSHNLGSTPGCIIIKNLTNAANWWVWHRGTSSNGRLFLNATDAFLSTSWIDSVGSSSFTINTANRALNEISNNYVAYLFAHDAGGFGDDGSQNVISCGSYVGDGTSATVSLGWEPQWILIKKSSSAGAVPDWHIYDNMRGIATGGNDNYLRANLADAEVTSVNNVELTATGFIANANIAIAGETYIYIAIRRGPMKTPEAGTEVFSPNAVNAALDTKISTNFPIDLQLVKFQRDSATVANTAFDRLRGVSSNSTEVSRFLSTNATSAETTNTTSTTRGFDNTGFKVQDWYANTASIYWNFRRAPSFFDVVCYTGTSVANTQVTHNLGVQPELIIVKARTAATNWDVLHTPTSYRLNLNTTGAGSTPPPAIVFGNDTTYVAPTASYFVLGTNGTVNSSVNTYVAYLFATCAGVSKVGSYTGTGTTLQVNCGFTGGARFVLIKRVGTTGDWYVWDTARGIVSGNDPYLLLNSTSAEVTNTDYIDTYSSGFEISSTAPAAINANGGTFIYLAIA